MKYRIEDRDGIRLIGCKHFISASVEMNYKKIPSLWDDLPQETFDELKSLSDSEPTGVLGVFAKKHDNGFDYWMAASTTKPCPEHFEILEIPPARWMIIEAKGALPNSIQDVFKRLYAEWFPASTEYARRQEVYEIEWFSDGDTNSDSYICEAWVPVIEK